MNRVVSEFFVWGAAADAVARKRIRRNRPHEVRRPTGNSRPSLNDAPVLWMLHDRGYDLTGLRKREKELQRELREAREENAALRRVLQGRT